MMLTILLGVHLAQRTAENGEILGIDVDDPVVDLAEAGDHAVAEEFFLFQAEIARMVRHISLQFDEGIGVEQVLDAVPGRHQAAGPALGQLIQPAGRVFFFAQLDQFLDFGFHLLHLWGKLYNHSRKKSNPRRPPGQKMAGPAAKNRHQAAKRLQNALPGLEKRPPMVENSRKLW